MAILTRSQSATQDSKDVKEIDEACAAISSTVVSGRLVQESSSFTALQPMPSGADSDTPVLDQPSSTTSPDGIKQESSSSDTMLQRQRRTLKLTLRVTKLAAVSNADVVLKAEELEKTMVITETQSVSQQGAAARGTKRGAPNQTPAKRSKRSAEDADEDYEDANALRNSDNTVRVIRSLRARTVQGTVTGAIASAGIGIAPPPLMHEVADPGSVKENISEMVKRNACPSFVTLKVPGLAEKYKTWRLRPQKRLNKKGFRFTRNQMPFWCSPTPYELREVVKILEAERMVLTKTAAQTGTAAKPFHAAKGLTVDSLVRVILSQSLTNEKALDMQQSLIYNYPYEVDGEAYEGTKPNYHEIREQSVSKLLKVLTGAGLQAVKAHPIKECLDVIYEKNLSLLKPGEVVYYGQEPGATDFVPGLLSMDFVWDAYRQGGKQAAFNELTALKQVGVKTAACLMSFNMGIPVFAVDTHVAAMSKLLG
ncbi:hypothetical protein A1O7_00352 [Cladophialophora yegresii CBS 114405]|uniref:HhH-GPD domain-containing protein n=1 Tax=Cladophialophora yegresii CBS 114405 TaxID=1182544 RepID=W9W7D8_9EURO|nr:uncharacterized protein A1O7_00352 [Cladophialophora yegresii CBS 114405]EXJ64017.1 hypothetical protein A1O7_00352 [Cladophialophora yegresii CBS 114405]